MNPQTITDDAPGTVLFPEYAELYELITREVTELTDSQLDFRSDRWAWADWSIRRQLSHMASLIYGWMIVRLGPTLFPDGNHGIDDIQNLTAPGFDRRLDDQRYRAFPIILHALQDGIALIQRVLAQRSAGFLRGHTIERAVGDHWRLMQQAHTSGVTLDTASSTVVMTIEAILRHIYFEETTHLYNIQRLKRAQGLPTIVAVPRVGYWVLDGWDRSEPFSDAVRA
jgi:uncharacterized damage-inducible protein DinB